MERIIKQLLKPFMKRFHLHELGTDIKLIQVLLGHNDINTTLRYVHVSNLTVEKIKSPFDNLNLNLKKE